MITNMVNTEFSMSAVLEMNLYICPAGVPEDLTFKLNQVFPAIFNKWSVFFILSLSFRSYCPFCSFKFVISTAQYIY